MRIEISGINMPGRVFCRPDGTSMDNVHVGVQIRSDPAQLVPAQGPYGLWEVDVEVTRKDGGLDFRGPSVHGTRGARFVYLTWGNVGPSEEFEMFRRAKLMLDRILPLDAVVCFGVILKGATLHFEMVSHAVTQGLLDVSLRTGTPILNEVLAVVDLQDAAKRSQDDHFNKGIEAAAAAARIVAWRRSLT